MSKTIHIYVGAKDAIAEHLKKEPYLIQVGAKLYDVGGALEQVKQALAGKNKSKAQSAVQRLKSAVAALADGISDIE